MSEEFDIRTNNPAERLLISLFRDEEDRCGSHIDSRKVRWFCSLEKGHAGDHCRVDMDLRYFKTKPTFRMTRTAAIPVRDLP